MRETFTYGTVGGALGNRRFYPELFFHYKHTNILCISMLLVKEGNQKNGNHESRSILENGHRFSLFLDAMCLISNTNHRKP